MAYLTCPDCRMPSPVEDSAISYRCFSCSAEIVFEACARCEYQQAIPSTWHGAFTCGHCASKVDIPRRRLYRTSVRARFVKGYGHTYPRF
jgi:hypothetical protein